MAEQVKAVLDAVFLGDGAQYAGAFQREVTLRFGPDPSGCAAYVAETAKYRSFIEAAVQDIGRAYLTGAPLVALTAGVADNAVAAARAGHPIASTAQLRAAVIAAPEFQQQQGERITKVATLCGRALTPERVQALMTIESMDALRAAIEALDEPPEAFDSEPDDDVVVLAAGGAGLGRETVDEDFMERFAAEYRRDATVHEYVHVRNLLAAGADLCQIRDRHFKAYDELEVIHRDFLDECLSQADFCKRYLPLALVDPTLPARHRDLVLASDGYKRSMCDRLRGLHKTRFGEELTDEESDYMFQTQVLSKSLSLQSGKLNDIVVAFAEQTFALFGVVVELYQEVLGREAEDSEVRDVLHGFRVDRDAATRALRAKLGRSLEYRDVLRQQILLARPDLKVPAVFRVLESALGQAGLGTRPVADIVAQALGA